MNRKIIIIGESSLEIIFKNDHPEESFPGGVLLNSAARLGAATRQVSFVSEAANDHVGDMIVKFLESNNVEVRSIDRYTEGTTPVRLIFENSDGGAAPAPIRYGSYPQESFGVVWPRIDPDDIVVFGGYYSVDPRGHDRIYDIVKYAAERRAIVVYVPNFDRSRVSRITRVMPAILENFESSSIVVSRTADLRDIFNKEDASKAFKDHVSFYSFNMVNYDEDSRTANFFHRKDVEELETPNAAQNRHWFAAFVAGIIDALIANEITSVDIENIEAEATRKVLTDAMAFAD
ncbi:MAG: carbohydrate kinase family protein [Muribaculum sp.]|nr:carbohydrate kinase family protein [Muribaculum sp.]